MNYSNGPVTCPLYCRDTRYSLSLYLSRQCVSWRPRRRKKTKARELVAGGLVSPVLSSLCGLFSCPGMVTEVLLFDNHGCCGHAHRANRTGMKKPAEAGFLP